MNQYNSILSFIEKDSSSINCHWSNYIVKQLKSEESLRIVSKIIELSNKVPSEAVFVFLAAIKYLQNNFDALTTLEFGDTFQNYISEHYSEIIEISVNKKVQANVPERALPIAEVLYRFMVKKPIILIELGASFGLIGKCLLNLNEAISQKEMFFQREQKLPVKTLGINKYIGIEIDPPDKNWLLSCYPDAEYARRVNDFICYYNSHPEFKLIKSSAFNFSTLSAIQELGKNDSQVVILTSFMLYQLDAKMQQLLKEEIYNFLKGVDGYWICQDVDLSKGYDKLEYYIELNGKRIIELIDDSCISWRWIDFENH